MVIARQDERRHERAIAGGADHEVHMGRSKRMTPELPEKLACRTVARNRIAHRPDGPERVLAIGAGTERRAEVAMRLAGILDVIELVRCRLPDLHFRTGHDHTVLIGDTA